MAIDASEQNPNPKYSNCPTVISLPTEKAKGGSGQQMVDWEEAFFSNKNEIDRGGCS
jgi:hypothetical protein